MKTLLVEYDSGVSLDHLVAYGVKMTELIKSVDAANARISANLNIKRNVLSISEGNIKAQGVAGVIRLSSDIELEIMPKFLSENSGTEWRTTLYLLSALSRNGKVLIDERIKSSSSYTNFLYDMAGRMLAEEYEKNKRKPIREYHKDYFFDYSIEGEIDFESYLEKNPNGIGQSVVKFDKKNIYNATICAAMKHVLPYVSDIKTRNVLKNAIVSFGGQDYKNGLKNKIPARNKEWERIYSLSYDIMQGLGSTFAEGNFYAPGFIANTWQMWEWLITVAITIGEKEKRVISQNSVQWGEKRYSGKKVSVNVYPDVTIMNKSGIPEYLVDAKYKLLENNLTGEISRADLYEAYAFCDSLETKHIFLTYPMDAKGQLPSGSVLEKSVYRIGEIVVHVIFVVFGPINEKGGIYNFSQKLVDGVHSILYSK